MPSSRAFGSCLQRSRRRS